MPGGGRAQGTAYGRGEELWYRKGKGGTKIESTRNVGTFEGPANEDENSSVSKEEGPM